MPTFDVIKLDSSFINLTKSVLGGEFGRILQLRSTLQATEKEVIKSNGIGGRYFTLSFLVANAPIL